MTKNVLSYFEPLEMLFEVYLVLSILSDEMLLVPFGVHVCSFKFLRNKWNSELLYGFIPTRKLVKK